MIEHASQRLGRMAAVAMIMVTGAPFTAGAAPVCCNDTLDAIHRTVAEVRGAEELDRERAAIRLARRGVGAVPVFFDLLSGRWEHDLTDDDRRTFDGEDIDLVRDALRRLPSEDVTSALLAQLTDESILGERLVVLRVLGDVASDSGTRAILDVLKLVPVQHLRGPFVANQIETALTKVLGRDPRGINVLGSRYRQLPPELLPVVVRSISSIGTTESVQVCERVLGMSPELDATVLKGFAHLRPMTIEIMGDYVAEQTRRYLQAPEPIVRRAAVTTLAALHDMNVMEDLLELLGDPDAGVRRATHEALKRFSGRNMPADAAMWESWWDSQLDWFLDDSEVLVNAGSHPAADWAIARLKDAISHPVFSQHTAFDVASMLEHNDESVAVFAALCLERLGEARVTSYLIESLQDPRPVVREAVARALRALTGEDHLAQYDAWSHWLDG